MDSLRSYTHLMSLHLWKRRALLRMFQHLPLNKAKLFLSQHPHFSLHPNDAPQQLQPKNQYLSLEWTIYLLNVNIWRLLFIITYMPVLKEFFDCNCYDTYCDCRRLYMNGVSKVHNSLATAFIQERHLLQFCYRVSVHMLDILIGCFMHNLNVCA